MAMPDPLQRQIQSITFSDTEIRRILHLAAVEAKSIINSNASDVRKAQVALANVSAQMWGGVGDATKVAIGDAVYGATEAQALFDEELFKAAGLGSQYWRASMIAQSREGINSIISRKENGITLSQRVYKNGKSTAAALNGAINAGLLLGKGPREIAADVFKYMDPSTPGGASYAAMRIGRSEVLNAYHTTTINNYKKTPWVDRAQWNLSGSHPRPDECNEYADAVNGKGWAAGVWRVDAVPAKPHPNCLCYLTPLMMDLDEYAKNFKSGKYDDYIDQQMGCYRGV